MTARHTSPRTKPRADVPALARTAVARLRVALFGAPPRAMVPKQGSWRFGEDAACAMLSKAGFTILGRNVIIGARHGLEADIVCEGPGPVYFVVEVKTRVRDARAPDISNAVAPEAAITIDKKRRLQRLARSLAALNRWPTSRTRVDAVAVELAPEGQTFRVIDIRHHVGVVRLG